MLTNLNVEKALLVQITCSIASLSKRCDAQWCVLTCFSWYWQRNSTLVKYCSICFVIGSRRVHAAKSIIHNNFSMKSSTNLPSLQQLTSINILTLLLFDKISERIYVTSESYCSGPNVLTFLSSVFVIISTDIDIVVTRFLQLYTRAMLTDDVIAAC